MTILRYTLFILYILLSLPLLADGAATVSDLSRKCELARSLSRYEQLDDFSAQLMHHARSQHDDRALTYAYFYNGLAKLFMGKSDEAMGLFDESEAMSVSTRNDSVRALVMNARGIYHAMIQSNNFVAQQYFFKSLALAEQTQFTELVYRVRGNLLTLSHAMGDSLALVNATEVYNYGIEVGNQEQAAMGAYYLASYYYKHEDYAQAEQYLGKAIDIHRDYPYEDVSSVYTLYAKMLITQGDLVRAGQMLEQSLQMAHKYNQASMEVDALITYAELLVARKDYPQAMQKVRKAMDEADRIGVTNKVIDCNQLMADCLEATGREREALDCLHEANRLLSSQATINMERLSHEQQVMHDIAQSEMNARLGAEKIAFQRIMLIMLLIVVVVLLVLLAFIIVSNRRRHVLYKHIVLQNSRAVRRQQEQQEQIEFLSKELERERSGKPDTQTEKEGFTLDGEKIDRLYAELCRLMETEKLFTEAQLTREKMAERLSTNRTYLTKVIKEKTGMNYLQYINSYRIGEAIRILSDKDKIDYPLKQIWSDLGFSSPSTFFKLFQQAVGITPSTYRKQFLEVKDEPVPDVDENLV